MKFLRRFKQTPAVGQSPVVLITVSGPDRPGITSELTRILGESEATILDIGQAVIHGLLSLSILFEMPRKDAHEKATLKDLLFKATELGLKLDFELVEPEDHVEHLRGQTYRYALTLVGERITANSLHHVAQTIVHYGLNIDTIQRLSDSAFSCVEILLSSAKRIEESDLRSDLLTAMAKDGVDLAIQSEGLFRRSKRLIVFDMDATLIQNEVIDELAEEVGTVRKVASITRAAMRGEMDFDESLVQRVKYLKGLKQEHIDAVLGRIQFTPGAEELITVLKALGYRIALISGGFTCITDKLQTQLGLDYAYANVLEFESGRATGEVAQPIVNAQRKAELLSEIARRESVLIDQVIAVGDGANDIPMLQKAGLGIAFNAKPAVGEKADTSINRNLDSIFYLLGIPERDVKSVLNDHLKP